MEEKKVTKRKTQSTAMKIHKDILKGKKKLRMDIIELPDYILGSASDKTMDSANLGQVEVTNYSMVQTHYNDLNNLVPVFLGFQYLGIASQIPVISSSINILPRASVKEWVKLVSTNDNEDTNLLKSRQDAIDKKYKIKQKVKNYLKDALQYGGALMYFNVEGQNENMERPFNPDAVTSKSFKDCVNIDIQRAIALVDETLTDPLSEWYYEPKLYNIISGSGNYVVHASYFAKCVPEPVMPTLKPTFRYFGLSTTQKMLPYARDNIAAFLEMSQLLKTKRHKIFGINTEQLFQDEKEYTARIGIMQEEQNNYNITTIYNGGGEEALKETFTHVDTSLADVPSVVDKTFEICASVAGIPVTKILGTLNRGGLGNSGEFDINTWHEVVSEFQESNMREVIELFYKVAFKSEYDIDIKDIQVVFNPIDEISQKDVADIESIKANVVNSLLMSGAITAKEARAYLQTSQDTGFNDLDPNALDDLGETNIETDTEQYSDEYTDGEEYQN